jgi:hypothetical protein
MRTISYTKLQENYSGEYIARKGSRIIAHAKTYPLLLKKLTHKKVDRRTLTIGFVPSQHSLCIYAS